MSSIFRRFCVTALVFWQSKSTVIGFVIASPDSHSCHAIQMADSSPVDEDVIKTIRVLALHGSEGNADEFPTRLESLKEKIAGDAKLEITAVQAPFVKGNGFAWWKMPPGVRSFTATEYEGFEESASKVLEIWGQNNNSNDLQQQPFDLVLGHSQGAILVGT